jgi:rhodanese-related sulfurtransferase
MEDNMTKKIIITILICSSFLISNLNIIQSKEITNSIKFGTNIPSEQLNQLINQDEDFILIDLRTYEEFYTHHIPKAKSYPYQILEEEFPSSLLSFKNKNIVLYSNVETMTIAATTIFKNKGFTCVSRLIGGFYNWINNGFSTKIEDSCCKFLGNYAVMNIGTSLTENFDKSVVKDSDDFKASNSNPSSFSWNNLDGEDWTTPAKNQGQCGSCWAFSAISSMESSINIAKGDPDFDLDLSEQYVLSCLGAAGSCGGGHTDSALAYIISTNSGNTGNGINGVPLESCMPYTGSDIAPCSSKCSEWDTHHVPPLEDDTLWQLDSYNVLNLNGENPSHREIVKQSLIEYGPMCAYMTANTAFANFWGNNHDPNSYYPDPGYVGPSNHAVQLVGYKDDSSIDNGGYWILKNSWGSSFGYDGFFNVEYGGLHIGDVTMYVVAPEWEDPVDPEIVKINLSYPIGGEIFKEGEMHEIIWTSENLTGQIELHYSPNNGSNYKLITRVPATVNSYMWRIPGDPSTECKLRVRSMEHKSISDELNDTFTIIGFEGDITLIKPNGGEKLQEGQAYDIKWIYTNVTQKIQLYFSNDGPKNFDYYIGSAPVDDEVYSWIVPSFNSTNCYIKIRSVVYSSLSDISDKAFSIKSLFNVHNVSLPGLRYSCVEWADYDNDGDLDILMSGDLDGFFYTEIFENEDGVFDYSEIDIVDLKYSCASWADYDNDGDLDLAIAGYDGVQNITVIYNNFLGNLNILATNIVGVRNGSLAWGDYDNDGDLDLAIAGYNGMQGVTAIYSNDNGVFNHVDSGLPGVSKCCLAWGDYDADTDLDLAITGVDNENRLITAVFQNQDNKFSRIESNIIQTYESNLDWGDYDNDGDLDLLVSGKVDIMHSRTRSRMIMKFSIISQIIEEIKEFINNMISQIKEFIFGNDTNENEYPYASLIYTNNNGVFKKAETEIIGIWRGCAKWVDYNSDGKLDITISGRTKDGPITKIYSNNNGDFTDTNVFLKNVYDCSFDWGDFDADSDLDLVITGYNGQDYVSALYINQFNN